MQLPKVVWLATPDIYSSFTLGYQVSNLSKQHVKSVFLRVSIFNFFCIVDIETKILNVMVLYQALPGCSVLMVY